MGIDLDAMRLRQCSDVSRSGNTAAGSNVGLCNIDRMSPNQRAETVYSVLILAAGFDKDDPGPLVSHLTKAAGSFPIPIGIVPAHLSDEELDALS